MTWRSVPAALSTASRDGLIGKEVGTTVDLPLTFPDPYTSPDLAGQDVVFEVTIHAIVEHVTPEWDDAFAKEYTGFDTAEAFEEELRTSLQQQKEADAAAQKEYEAMQAVIADSEFECSEEELKSIRDSLTQEYEMYASYYGMELDDYLLQAMQMSREDFDSEIEGLGRISGEGHPCDGRHREGGEYHSDKHAI